MKTDVVKWAYVKEKVLVCTMSDFLAVSIGFDRQNETAAVLGHVGSIEEDACMGLVVRQFERLTKYPTL